MPATEDAEPEDDTGAPGAVPRQLSSAHSPPMKTPWRLYSIQSRFGRPDQMLGSTLNRCWVSVKLKWFFQGTIVKVTSLPSTLRFTTLPPMGRMIWT